MHGRLAGLVISGMVLATAADVSAGTPQQRVQAPGYYRMMVGDFEVTALSDGTARIALTKQLPSLSAEEVAPELNRWHRTDPYEMSINAFLVNTGSQLILIDTGLGSFLAGKAGGRMTQNMIASGYRPDEIDAVLITHFHVDHVSGLSQDGKATFPNATIYMSERERAYWLGPEAEKSSRPEVRDFIPPSRAAIKPYVDAGRVKTFDSSAMLWDGVKAELTPGHSPGHAVYSISSRDQVMSFIGDLVHAREIQFSKPDATFIYDSDRDGAVQQRKQVFARLAKSRSWVATAHLSFPGIGHIRADGAAFDWVPASYSLQNLK